MKVDIDKIVALAYSVFYVAAVLLVPAFLWYMGLPMLAVLFTAPIFAWVMARLLVKYGGEGFSWLAGLAMQKWQGSYYAFNDVQVRVYEEDDELWFVVPDVLKAVGIKAVPRSYLAIYPDGAKVLAGTGLTVMNNAALEHMLGKRNDHEAIRFLTWMRRDVVKPWERKRERA